MIFKNLTIENLAAKLPEYKDIPEATALMEYIEKCKAIGMSKIIEALQLQAAACVLEQMKCGLLAITELTDDDSNNYINSKGECIKYHRPDFYNKVKIGHIQGNGTAVNINQVTNDNEWVITDWCYWATDTPLSERQPMSEDYKYIDDYFYVQAGRTVETPYANKVRYAYNEDKGSMFNVMV